MKYFAITRVCVICLLFSTLHNLHAWSHSDYKFRSTGLILNATDSITNTSNFNSIKVIDLRLEKDTIGIHLARSKSYVMISDSLPQMIEALGEQVIHSAATKDNRQLLIVIKDIFLRSREGIGSLHFRVDFYLGNDNKYQLVSKMDSLYQFIATPFLMEKNSLKYLDDVATYAIINCATTLPLTEARMPLTSILNEDSIAKSKQPIYAQAPKDGVYYTYSNFTANTPSDTAFTYVPYYYFDKKADHFYLSENGHKYGKNLIDTACFAICYKGKWYKKFDDHDFKEMKMEGGDFVFLTILPSIRYYGNFLKPGDSITKYHLHSSEQVDISQLKQDKQIYKLRIDALTGKMYKVRRYDEYSIDENIKSLQL